MVMHGDHALVPDVRFPGSQITIWIAAILGLQRLQRS